MLGTIQMLINLALIIGLKVSIHNHNEKGEIACMSGMLTMEGIALAEVGASLVAPEVVSQEGVEGLVNMGILTPGIASGFKDGLFTHGMGNLLGGQGGAGVAAKYLNDWHNRGTPDPQNPYGNQAWNGNRSKPNVAIAFSGNNPLHADYTHQR